MSLLAETDPWWLPWVLPGVAAVSAVGGALIWLGRVVLLPGIKGELEELLKERFDDAQELVEQRHQENQEDIHELKRLVEEGTVDRKQIRKELADVAADVAYLRGKSSGTFRRP